MKYLFALSLLLAGCQTIVHTEEFPDTPGMKCVRECWNSGGYVWDFNPKDYEGRWGWKDCECRLTTSCKKCP